MGRVMASDPRPNRSRPRRGGGIFIAAGLVLGAVAGVVLGQPSLGLVGGLALGVAAAVALAVADRRG